MLTDASGKVTDTYDYDAFGNLIHTTGSTPNVYLYRGEQYDPDLGLYYLRARYYNPSTGRFLTRDPDAGLIRVPATLHKYLYAAADPVNRIDPSGRAGLLMFTIQSGGYLAFTPGPIGGVSSCVMNYAAWGAALGALGGGVLGAAGGVVALDARAPGGELLLDPIGTGVLAGGTLGYGLGGLVGAIKCARINPDKLDLTDPDAGIGEPGEPICPSQSSQNRSLKDAILAASAACGGAVPTAIMIHAVTHYGGKPHGCLDPEEITASLIAAMKAAGMCGGGGK
jgi:RHS repeat-associated protein